MGSPSKLLGLSFTVLLIVAAPCGAEKINALIIGHAGIIQVLRMFFDNEPLITYQPVMTRALETVDAMKKQIRLYYPRTYEQMKKYDLIILTSPEYYLLSNTQDRWIRDAIREGAGGINDGSLFSIVTDINAAWAASLAQQAFPNDVDAVLSQQWRMTNSFNIFINRQARYPILTPFVPYDVEKVSAYSAHGLVVAREAAETLAWQTGFPGKGKVGYIVAWEYGEGRSITTGDFLGNGWLGYPSFGGSGNQHSPDILMNMILWITHRGLITRDTVDIFHSLKGVITEFRTRLSALISLRDFVDKFGANTEKIQDEILNLEGLYNEGTKKYVDQQDFSGAYSDLKKGLEEFSHAEAVAQRVKERALLWIYIIEWLITTSALFISGFILWTLMVRRRLYREVKVTKLTHES